MSTAVLKGLIVAGGIGISGIGGWQAYENLRPITILEKLMNSDEDYAFSTFDDDTSWDDAAWKSIAKKYQSDQSSTKLNGVTITNGDNPAQNEMEALIRECRRLVNLNTRWEDRTDEIEKVKKWCQLNNSSR